MFAFQVAVGHPHDYLHIKTMQAPALPPVGSWIILERAYIVDEIIFRDDRSLKSVAHCGVPVVLVRDPLEGVDVSNALEAMPLEGR